MRADYGFGVWRCQRLQGHIPSISTSSAKLSRIRTIDDDAQNSNALVGRVDDDRPHDVGNDQHLQAEQDRATEITTQLLVGAGRRSGYNTRRRKIRNAPKPPRSMIPAPTASTTRTMSETVLL